MKKPTLKQLGLNYIFVVAFVLIIAYTIFSYVKLDKSINDVEWISRSEGFQVQVDEIAFHLEEAVTEHANYLSTKDPNSKKSYHGEVNETLASLERSKSTLRDSVQKQKFSEAEDLVLDQIESMNMVLRLDSLNTGSIGLKEDLLSKISRQMARVNSHIRKMTEADKKLMNKRIDEFEDSTSDVLFQTVLFGVITLVIAIVAFLKISYDLKRRKNSEKALLESNLKFQALFDQSFQFVGLTDAQGFLIDANKPALEFLGIDKEELEGKSLLDFTRFTINNKGKEIIKEAVRSAQAGNFYRNDLKVNSTHSNSTTIDFSLKPFFDEEGKITLLIAEGRDVTELHKTTEALAESREIYDLVLRGSSAGIWDWMDVNEDANWWSPKFYELLGFAPSEINASISQFKNLLHPDDIEQTLRELDLALNQQKSYQVEYRLRTKSGEYRWFHATAQANWDSSGKATRMAGSIIDITERKRAEATLNDVAQLMAAAENIARIGSFEWNINTNHMIWSEGMYKIYEKDNNEIQPSYEYMTRHIVKEDFKDNQEIVKEAHLREMPYQVNYRIRVNGKIKHLKELAQVKRDEDDNFEGFIGTVRDNTNEVFAAKRINMAMEELERSNEELEQFAYVASHDLQEPLRKIRAFGDRLLSKYSEEDLPGKEYVDRMQNAAERMQILIDDLLTFSRVSRGPQREEKIDLQEVFQEVTNDLSILLNSEDGSIKRTEKLPVIEGNRTQIRQLFQNILGNAIKFAKKGEPPVVEVSYKKVNSGEVFSHDKSLDLQHSQYHQIVIKDNGIGFDEEYLDKIFTIFQRLHGKSDYKGTGIGLAVCKKIVENHSGILTAKSEPGKGAQFYIFLPDRL